jgi:hypothetical protein
MEVVTIRRLGVRGLLSLVVVAWLAFFNVQTSSAETSYPVLKTRTGTYTNATVTTTSKKYIFILHSTGMANIKIQDLLPETLRDLGYVVPEDKPAKSNVVLAKQLIPNISEKIKPFEASWQNNIQLGREKLNVTPAMMWGAAGALLFLYLFNCYCCHAICMKAKAPRSILVWLPGLQMIPLLRAAGMSAWWFLAFFVPLLSALAWVLWSLNIAKARDKGVLVAIFLILPITTPLAFLYLAFSGMPASAPTEKYKSMSLQTA